MPSVSLPLVAAGVGAAGSIGGALIQSGAAKSAAATQAAAAQQAEQTQVQATNTSLQQLAPYNQIGTGAANSLANLYGIPYAATSNGQSSTSPSGIVTPANINASASSPGGAGAFSQAYNAFTQSPTYQFAFQQGLQALQRSAAAGGSLISGGQLKAGTEFGQGLASQQLGNYTTGLQSLASMGQNAAAGQASNSLAGANSVANSQQAAGQASASGTVGSANALAGGLGGVSSSVMNSLLLSKLGGTSPSAYAGLNTAYNNSTGNYGGLSNVGQDALQDNPLTSDLLT